MNIDELREEILNDPEGLGYFDNGNPKNDEDIANLLNQPTQTKQRASVDVADAAAYIKFSEWEALPDSHRQYLLLLAGLGRLNLANTNLIGAITTIFPPTTTVTGAIFTQLLGRAASRAEVLFGDNVVISSEDVAMALRG